MSHVNCQLSHVTCLMSCGTFHVPCVIYHVSHVACHLSPVTCHLSLMQTAAATASHPLLTLPLCTVGLFEKTQKPKIVSKPKISTKPKNVDRYANISDMLFDQKSPVHPTRIFCDGTNTHPDNSRTSGLRG